jgi:adenosylcobinamide-GDP ribazoletransferase
MRAAVAFLTPLPFGGGAPDRRTLRWFPAVGAAIGALVGAAWWAGGEVLPVAVAAAVAVVADLVLTGALHADGLADSADGLLPPHDEPARRRAVMAAPDVGAFGVAAVGAVLLLRWSALASMDPDVALVAALWSTSRSIMAIALLVVPYVGGGLGTAFLGAGRRAVAVVAALVTGALVAVAGDPAAAAVSVGAALLTGALVVGFGRRRLGGVTGDVVGAAGLLAETVGLVVASARW